MEAIRGKWIIPAGEAQFFPDFERACELPLV